MPGMPYHLEKGAWLSVLEDYLNGDPNRTAKALTLLRDPDLPVTDTGFLASPALDGDPEYNTDDKRQRHLQQDWFGWPAGGSTWPTRATFAQEVLDLLPADAAAIAADAPGENATAEQMRAWTTAVAPLVGPDFDGWPATGFWHQYFGDVEGIVRETLIRALEVSLGLDHGQEIPTDGPVRRLPIELFWKCPQCWFDGWVTWRFDRAAGTGQVTVLFTTPGSGKPILEQALDGAGAFVPRTSRTPATGPAPAGPAPSDPAANAEQAAKGMWVVTHTDNLQLPVLPSAGGRPSGQWLIPPFGPAYVGVGPVVCVQPSEPDGGVAPLGRAYTDPPDDPAVVPTRPGADDDE